MRSFHVMIQRYDLAEDRRAETIKLDGQSLSPREIEPHQLNLPLTASFDDALDQLGRLPRMFTEPDGSFVWVGQAGSESWQLDGQLHDGATGLMDVELKGTTDVRSLAQLLDCLGSTGDRFVIQLVREGVFLDPSEFQRLIWPGE